MTYDLTTLFNLALWQLGARRVTAYDEDTKEAQTLNALYPAWRDDCLSRNDWTFAVRRASLALLVEAPAFGASYQFRVPPDCLRVIETSDGMDCGYLIEADANGKVLLTDSATISIRYISRVENPAFWSPSFYNALATGLASAACIPLTAGGEKRQQVLYAAYRAIFQDAMGLDTIETGTPRKSTPTSTLVALRR